MKNNFKNCKLIKMSHILQLLLDQPDDLLDQLYQHKNDLTTLHLSVAADLQLRDACLYLKGVVDSCDSTYLKTLKGCTLKITDTYKRWTLNDKLHREDRPAIECGNGDKEWWVNGKRHREDGPAVERRNGFKAWRVNGKLHREDGPAVEYAHGAKEWWIHGKRHRDDGPAVEYAHGAKEWWIHGKLHRDDGPAIERKNGVKEWWVNEEKLTEQEFNSRNVVKNLANEIAALIAKYGKKSVLQEIVNTM